MSGRGEGPEERPVKRSVALAVADPADGDRVLLVLRPPDDEDLPDVWGLPAASLIPGESWEAAVRRAALEKLGVEVEPTTLLAEGRTERPGYTLSMRLYRARVVRGEPRVGADVPGGRTRYVAWRWAEADVLLPAAERGSLCARLFLDSGA